jgi:hypothetical protein
MIQHINYNAKQKILFFARIIQVFVPSSARTSKCTKLVLETKRLKMLAARLLIKGGRTILQAIQIKGRFSGGHCAQIAAAGHLKLRPVCGFYGASRRPQTVLIFFSNPIKKSRVIQIVALKA